MNESWGLDEWTPTAVHLGSEHATRLSDENAASRITAVHTCTAALGDSPYDPVTWLKRAKTFLDLGYPELAVGDAYKARLLSHEKEGKKSSTPTQNSVERSTSPGDDHDVDLLWSILRVLQSALYSVHCHWDALKVCKELVKLYPDDPEIEQQHKALSDLIKRKMKQAQVMGGTSSELRDRIRDGAVRTVIYPWTPERHTKRSRVVLEDTQKELDLFGTCKLSPSSTITQGRALSEAHDVLGVFASRSIRQGTRALAERTPIGATSASSTDLCSNCYRALGNALTKAACCGARYCSEECRDQAQSIYHKVLCGQDFGWLQAPAKGYHENNSTFRPLLMLRMLAVCIQNEHQHPLDHPIIARMQAQTHNNHIDVFTFEQSVVQPIRILQQLGIDVFADLSFDTWVLHTIWTRLANNKRGFSTPQGYTDCLNSLFALFNHSCEPNLRTEVVDGSTTVEFYAARDIQEGEEMFNSYRNVEGLDLETRTEMLWPWFEGPCLCTKCTRERKALG